MKRIPRVSVVLPTFNRANELLRSIKSVLSQTFDDLELIVIDDGSTDETENIVRSIVDTRIRYEKLTNNVGGAEARNVGIRMSRSEIIAFQDSDDEWLCSKLEKTLYELESDKSVGAVFSAFIEVSKSGCRMLPIDKSSIRVDKFYETLLWQNVVGTPTMVVKKVFLEEIGYFDSSMPRYQDWDLALRMSKSKLMKFKFIDDPLIISYVTDGSISSNVNAHCMALEKIYKKHDIEINKKKDLKIFWLNRLGDAMIKISIKDGSRFYFEVLKENPANIRYMLKIILSIIRVHRL